MNGAKKKSLLKNSTCSILLKKNDPRGTSANTTKEKNRKRIELIRYLQLFEVVVQLDLVVLQQCIQSIQYMHGGIGVCGVPRMAPPHHDTHTHLQGSQLVCVEHQSEGKHQRGEIGGLEMK